MPWTDEQIGQMIDAHFAQQPIRCPDCDSLIRFNRAATSGYFLHGSCPKGHGGIQITRDQDPRKNEFRDWTEAELDTAVNSHLSSHTPKCPVDNSVLDVTENSTNQANRYVISCPRCNRRYVKEFPIKRR